jgi:hypothetical protein
MITYNFFYTFLSEWDKHEDEINRLFKDIFYYIMRGIAE